MSLEQALAENTATMKQLIAVLASAVEAGGVTVPAGEAADAESAEPTKRKRRTKAEIEADNAAAAAAAAAIATAAAPAAPAAVGNVAPAPAPAPAPEPQPVATPSASPAVAVESAASTATPSASPVTMQSITAKLMAIHKRDGNAGVKPILDRFGVANVPALAGQNLAEVDAAVESILNPAASASLFG